jgi:hypothetical protein
LAITVSKNRPQGDFKSALQNWRDEYGDIVGLKLGNELAVILSDYDVVSA